MSQHRNATCRNLHFFGTSLVLTCLMSGLLISPEFLIAMPFVGYGFAWIGHFFFEHNRPATFKHPLYSFASDWVMFKDILTGRIKF